MAGDFTSQKFLGSMEGATLAGKLAAEVVANRARGNPDKQIKEIQQHVITSASSYVAKEPVGVKGDGAIAFGGGYTVGKKEEELLRETDPAQYDAKKELAGV
jgi:15-cis-phytoene desaturase